MQRNRIPKFRDRASEAELIASFGGAQILKSLSGKLEIRGGTPEERTQAQTWMDTFLTQKPHGSRTVKRDLQRR